MEIRIGLHQSARELTIDTEQSGDEVRKLVREAFAADAPALLSLTDSKQREYLVPVDMIIYVEFGGSEPRKVGFVS